VSRAVRHLRPSVGLCRWTIHLHCYCVWAFERNSCIYKVDQNSKEPFSACRLICVIASKLSGPNQGCQIFLGPNIPKWEKQVKWPQTIPNCRTLYVDGALSSSWPKKILYWTSPMINLFIMLKNLYINRCVVPVCTSVVCQALQLTRTVRVK
jgi:hypothetical protein